MTKTTIALLALVASLASPAAAEAVPREFFGIAPQTELTDTDVEYMRAGRIGSIRVPVPWSLVQPTPKSEYDWSGLDAGMEIAARGHLKVLPFLYSTPGWLTRKPTTLPIDSARGRKAWVAFIQAAVERYGPSGEFWAERAPGAVLYQPAIPSPTPIRTWQVWNEANFFYFASPASPTRYARLLKLTNKAIEQVDPGAEVILSGLFGSPTAKYPNGMPAVDFLDRLYRVPGIKASFDSVALHPYADRAGTLREMTEEVRQVLLDHHDPRTGLYITEMGWGSQNNPEVVSFERGVYGQVRELRDAYRYLIGNRARLSLKGTYWFSWKDFAGPCNFCDSVGLFRQGKGLRPKPSWHAFVGITGGRARP